MSDGREKLSFKNVRLRWGGPGKFTFLAHKFPEDAKISLDLKELSLKIQNLCSEGFGKTALKARIFAPKKTLICGHTVLKKTNILIRRKMCLINLRFFPKTRKLL